MSSRSERPPNPVPAPSNPDGSTGASESRERHNFEPNPDYLRGALETLKKSTKYPKEVKARIQKELDEKLAALEPPLVYPAEPAELETEEESSFGKPFEPEVKDILASRNAEEEHRRRAELKENLNEVDFSEKTKKALVDIYNKERLKPIVEFKEKLGIQKQQLALLQEHMVEVIEKNPDLSYEELTEEAGKFNTNFSLTEAQHNRVSDAIAAYPHAHEIVKQYTEQYPDPAELFEKVFGFEPEGDIETAIGPMTIGFRCSDKDFKKILGGKYPNETLIAQRAGGVLLNAGFENLGLNNLVFLENTKFTGDSESTQAHEKQHAINNLLRERLFMVRPEDIFKHDRLNNEKELSSYLFLLRHGAEERTRDEVIAYYRNQLEGADIVRIINTPKSAGGLYDFVESDWKEIKEAAGKTTMTPEQKKKLNDLFEEKYNKRYQNSLQQGIEALGQLEKKGFSREQAISLLQQEPLGKWAKTEKRFLSADNFEAQKVKFDADGRIDRTRQYYKPESEEKIEAVVSALHQRDLTKNEEQALASSLKDQLAESKEKASQGIFWQVGSYLNRLADSKSRFQQAMRITEIADNLAGFFTQKTELQTYMEDILPWDLRYDETKDQTRDRHSQDLEKRITLYGGFWWAKDALAKRVQTAYKLSPPFLKRIFPTLPKTSTEKLRDLRATVSKTLRATRNNEGYLPVLPGEVANALDRVNAYEVLTDKLPWSQHNILSKWIWNRSVNPAEALLGENAGSIDSKYDAQRF